MFIITNNQIRQLGAGSLERIAIIVINNFKHNYPEYIAGYPDFIVRAMIQKGVSYAISSGMYTDYGITLFVAFMFISAPNFFELEKIKQIFF